MESLLVEYRDPGGLPISVSQSFVFSQHRTTLRRTVEQNLQSADWVAVNSGKVLSPPAVDFVCNFCLVAVYFVFLLGLELA